MNRLKQIIHEIHRRSLWQVLGIYAAASWAVLQVVDTLGGAWNLPDWFPSFAFALLLIGLPFVLATAFVQDGISGAKEGSAPPVESPSGPFTWRNALVGGVVAFALWGVVAAGWILLGGSTSESSEVAEGSVGQNSVAVLPFVNIGGAAEDEYFSDGITEELLNALGRLPDVRVPARTSSFAFKGQNIPIRQIAGTLDVAHVVEGSVRRSGQRVLITAQLVDARTDTQLWSDTFERRLDDVFAIQREIAGAVADHLQVLLSGQQREGLVADTAVDPRAHDAYLRGRYFFNRPSDENLRRAIAQFEEAVAIDSTFAAAYSGLSDAYLWAGYNEGYTTSSAAKPHARAAAEKAVALDDNSAEAHTSLAVFKLFYELDWSGSEAEFRRAMALNPNYAYAPDQYALLLAFTGRYQESGVQSRRALELDPLSPQVYVDAAIAPIFQKDVDAVSALMSQAIELDPTYFFPVMVQGWARLNVGRLGEAIPYLMEARTMGAPPFVTAFLSYAYGAAGDRAQALAELEALREESGGEVTPFNLALVYLGLGDHARAIQELERARAADSQFLGWLGKDAIFDPLRSDPRFVALLRELNFVN